MSQEKKVFTATSIRGQQDIFVDEIIPLVCYYYPQYTIREAEELPYFRVVQLLEVAQREKAREYAELVKIVAAPHTQKGRGVKKLLDSYQRIIEKISRR